jgi:predicted metal-dependent hydrolase
MADAARKQAFKHRVHQWADRLDVQVVQLSVRPMRRKWASCSTNGRLNFNVELLGLDTGLWDYVIVHELLHFSVPNHGRLWKSLMQAHVGDYEAMELRLARHAPSAHFR